MSENEESVEVKAKYDKVHLFKEYYVRRRKVGQEVLKIQDGYTHAKTGEYIDKHRELVLGYPHEDHIYSFAIRKYLSECMLDEEVEEFKDLVRKLETLKIEIEEMLKQQTKGRG